MYGWRGRIGLMLPTGNSVNEPEFAKMAPDGVSVHANRIALKDVTPASLAHMEDDVARSASGLASIRLGVIAFGCTSGSFVGGKGHDERLIRLIEETTGVAATTTSTAVVRALRLFGVERIAMATPYVDEVNALEVAYMRAHGFDVVRHAGGGITETADIQECEPSVAYRRAREVDDDRAQALFISCTGFRTIEIIEMLEADLGKPVITANQATFADALRILGVRDVRPGYGSLFATLFAVPPHASHAEDAALAAE